MRLKLHERRLAVNLPVTFESVAGRKFNLVITVGYDDSFQLKEVFCADFKSGSDNQAIIMDACILLSRLLQHGDMPQELVKSMCNNPPSLIGTICKAVCDEQELAVQDGVSVGFNQRVPDDAGPTGIEPIVT